jgi:drug/metabolite transporter (DMT)-like permease
VDDSILMPDEASIPAIIVDSENSNEGLINSTTILNAVPNVSDNSVEAEFIRIAGVIMALLSAFCVAVVFVVIRKISKRADPLNVVFYYHWTLIPFALIFAPMVPTSMDSSSWMIPQKIETWALVFLGTFFGTASQFCMTKGLQTETAARASSMNYTQVIFAFTAEWILWGISPSPMTLFGAGIIIGSILSAEIYKNKVNK